MLKLITADEVGHRMTSLDADLLLLVAQLVEGIMNLTTFRSVIDVAAR